MSLPFLVALREIESLGHEEELHLEWGIVEVLDELPQWSEPPRYRRFQAWR
ncbi:MAG: hypothetical protein ABI124_05540 [Terrimesophilobacter sp.]